MPLLTSETMIGQAIKHYQVEELLGQGGMGVVYKARDTRLGRPVALKVLPPEWTRDQDRKNRFLQEARAAAAVTHPAIAQVYDVDEGPEGLFIAMELVQGKTVKALIQGRELDLLGALEIASQVGGGLQKAHEAGIVHRDIKPENIVVTPDGHAKILDFGLAKLLEPTAPEAPEGISHMETLAKTQAGFVLGTLRYMSPEQARGQAVDHRSDIFSLGIVLYEMVTGQLPFSGTTALDTLHAIAFEETRPMTALRANLPPSLQRVVTRCLRKRAQDRYPDAKELVGDLKTVQREVESGISSKAPLGLRLQEQWRSLRDRTLGEWLLPGVVLLIALAVLLSVFAPPLGRGSDPGPDLARHRGALHLAPLPPPAPPPRPALRGEGPQDARGPARRPRRHALHRRGGPGAGEDLRARERPARLGELQHVLRRPVHPRHPRRRDAGGGEGAALRPGGALRARGRAPRRPPALPWPRPPPAFPVE